MKLLQAQLRVLGGTICLVKANGRQNVSPDARRLHDHLLHEFRREHLANGSTPRNNENTTLSSLFLIFLQRKRKLIYKELYAAKEIAILERANELDKRRIAHALKNGSTIAKSFVPLPMVVNILNDPQKLVCDAEEVKATTRAFHYAHSCK